MVDIIQQAAAAELAVLNAQWAELSKKTLEMEAACAALEREVESLREEASKKAQI